MRVIGLISGTSADAVEAVACLVAGAPPRLELAILAARSSPIEAALRARIHAAATVAGSDVEAICLLDAELAELFADAALALVAEMGLRPADIDLIGSHGQTLWHAVRADGSVASTLQVGNGSAIAERTGITTVSDLRSRDVAAGGQGAPIVAYVDWLLFRDATAYRAVQNLGGIGNVAYLPPLSDGQTSPMAFDTGPANVLIDVLMALISDGRLTFDQEGATAARGEVDEGWLPGLLAHPYFERRPPKTTGRELFSPAMGAGLLATGRRRGLADEDIVATVTALSADSVVDQYSRFLPLPPEEVIVAGGGTRNPVLMARLSARLPSETRLMTLEDLGYASRQKEAMAMAVLAYETIHGRPGTLPEFTGARRAVLMGAISPGRATVVEPPAGRTGATTEALNPKSSALDSMGTLDVVTLMNDEDATVALAIRPALPAISAAIDAISARLRGGGRLVYAGAGTSGRLAMLDAVECVPTFGVPPTLVTVLLAGGRAALTGSVEDAEDDAEAARADVGAAGVGPGDALVGIAASGSTAYVLEAIHEAKRRGALTVAISNNDPAPILEVADHAIAVPTGPEVLAGFTRLKAGTAQKLVLNMLSTATMVRLGKVHGNRMVDVAVSNQKLRSRAEGIVADLTGRTPDEAAALLAAANDEVKVAVLMGLRSIDAGTARRLLGAGGGVLRQALAADSEC